MNRAIDKFDNMLSKIITRSYQAVLDCNFIDLHILTLNHELNILKEFETVEEQLSNKVNSILTDLIQMEDVISKANNVIEAHKRALQENQDKQKDIQEHFLIVVHNNKFYDFLRRIFRKKYKPPKVHREGKKHCI